MQHLLAASILASSTFGVVQGDVVQDVLHHIVDPFLPEAQQELKKIDPSLSLDELWSQRGLPEKDCLVGKKRWFGGGDVTNRFCYAAYDKTTSGHDHESSQQFHDDMIMASRLSGLIYDGNQIREQWDAPGEDAYRAGAVLRSYNLKENVNAIGIQWGESSMGLFEECGGGEDNSKNTLWLAYRGSDVQVAKTDFLADMFAAPVSVGFAGSLVSLGSSWGFTRKAQNTLHLFESESASVEMGIGGESGFDLAGWFDHGPKTPTLDWMTQWFAKRSRCPKRAANQPFYDRVKLTGHSMGGASATLVGILSFMADDVESDAHKSQVLRDFCKAQPLVQKLHLPVCSASSTVDIPCSYGILWMSCCRQICGPRTIVKQNKCISKTIPGGRHICTTCPTWLLSMSGFHHPG